MKVCPRCKVKQAVSGFQKNATSPDGLQYHCRACRKSIDARPEKRKADRQRYHANTDGYRNQHYRRSYGITLPEYDALLKRQRGRCAICRNLCKSGKRLAVDHNHTTGRVRGLLCGRCNPLLGYAADDVNMLREAIKYLRRHAG